MPGCGDHSILTAVQMLMPELGVRRENTVFISGITCSSRFPHYMNTYGLDGIPAGPCPSRPGWRSAVPTSTCESSPVTATGCPSAATT